MNFIGGFISGAQSAQNMKLKREEANRLAKESEARLRQYDVNIRKEEAELDGLRFKIDQMQKQQVISDLGNHITVAARTGDTTNLNNFLQNTGEARNAVNMVGISSFISPNQLNPDALNSVLRVIAESKNLSYDELPEDIIEQFKQGVLFGMSTGGEIRAIPMDELGVFLPQVALANAERDFAITKAVEGANQEKLKTTKIDYEVNKLALENDELKIKIGTLMEATNLAMSGKTEEAQNLLNSLNGKTQSYTDKQKMEQDKNRQDALKNGNLVKAQANSSKPGDITTMTDDFSTIIKNKTGKNPSELTTEQYALLQQKDPNLNESASYINSIRNKDDTNRERQEKRILSNKELPKSILNIKSSDTGVFDQLKSGLGAYVRDVLDLVIDRIPINAMNIQNQQILQVLKPGTYISNAQAKDIQKIFTDNSRGYKDVQDKLIAIAQIMQSVIEYQQQDELGRFATARDRVYIKELIMMAKENIKLYDISSDLPDSTVDRRVEDGFVIFTIPDKNKKVASTTYSEEELEKLKKDKTKNYIIDKATGKLVSIAELEKRNGR